ncbi:tripartite tricarboxylate transporter permease [Bradyrhizobium liaoningense]|uniref:tripartite tricarboxylate transporter permease n=1 Tax=Bradyrhizobium liaoningense TaxID=43992 RepID=UPI001BAD199F|nr:tripartite tricarboxylate transporter permease [Bradyrhizobium liaoningense]MBR0843252.1 tripartite tricarboxylate transporter permease [Bradyrhizobium liaoningense]MBR0857011.1 tripartite tricarboxylate transporter permease [Bradyrhizobium liaoningense]
MDIIHNLSLGISVALSAQNLLYALAGCVIGTLIGVLPGIGPVATIAMLLPITFHLPPTAALIMLAGIYYGAQYGGSTTSILVNLPGEASSVVTCIDGYQMARRGRAGAALSISAVGSFFAGTVGTIVIVLFAAPLTQMAQKFGPADYCSLMVLGLMAAIVLANGSVLKAIAMVLLGLLFGLVGTDVNTGTQRFTFDVAELSDGIDFAPIAMGLFGITEIILNFERRSRRSGAVKVGSLWPTREEVRRAWPAVLRGTGLGSILGVLPGGGPTLGAFSAYMLEKKISRDPSAFGRGAVEGVAGPESANNAAAQTSFIPMLTLGIPSNAVMALMVGAMIIQGIQPGPEVMMKNPELFWGMVASMWIGNFMLVIINLPLIGIWVKLLTVPYRFLAPAILLFCCIGAFSLQNSSFHIMQVAAFGVLGYIFARLGCEGAPFLLGLVLGPQLEEYFRRAMLLSRGDPLVFIQRPISLSLLLAATALLILMILPNLRQARNEAFQEEEV